MSKKNHVPKDIPLVVYEFTNSILPPFFSKFFKNFFFTISPDVPYDLSKRIRDKNYWNPIKYGFLIGIILCFVLTGLFCFSENVLYPGQMSETEREGIVFFLEDWVNLIMYIIITPATFGIGLAMLLATFRTWYQLDNSSEDKRSSIVDWKGFIVISIILVAASVAISYYINDIVNIESEIGQTANELHYWFLGNPSNTNLIKPVTVYYTILNFLILVFTLSCVAIFVTAVRPIIKLSNSIARLESIVKDNEENLVERLSAFADTYLLTKVLLAIIMIHSFVWSWSPLATTNNFDIERGFILFVSIFFIAIPRLHFELEWFKVASRYKEEGIDVDLKPNYFRKSSYYLIWILDYLIIGSYFLSVLDIINFGPYS